MIRPIYVNTSAQLVTEFELIRKLKNLITQGKKESVDK